ncbi:hypothetical protein QR98_0065680 [Sarcoptes scabiei]|uniref:Uncharacterized protein n=1 Tax=Sarcoptes scabiei TaxID=52283 RepID=A0A132ABV2_SARSC|nr:hypothetical protein QR98_0065680 [Sarcoptes scabiei]
MSKKFFSLISLGKGYVYYGYAMKHYIECQMEKNLLYLNYSSLSVLIAFDLIRFDLYFNIVVVVVVPKY